MWGIVTFVFSIQFLMGLVVGGLVGKFVLPYVWKPTKV